MLLVIKLNDKTAYGIAHPSVLLCGHFHGIELLVYLNFDMVLETHSAWQNLNFWKNFYCFRKCEMVPEIVFLNLMKDLVIKFY